MQALLAAAMLDGVYERSAPALAKLERVLAHYQAEKNPLMQAMTVNAMGEVCQRAGDLERAQHWFECALPLAVESENALVLATVAKNLGSLSALVGDHASAVQYFDGLAQIAPKMLDNETLSWALEQRGLSEAALGQNQRAIETWQRGADLCRNTDHLPGLSAHLDRLRDAHGEAGHIDEQRYAERELDRIDEALENA
jgi:tetratricopeptide (TPR) repeat protein